MGFGMPCGAKVPRAILGQGEAETTLHLRWGKVKIASNWKLELSFPGSSCSAGFPTVTQPWRDATATEPAPQLASLTSLVQPALLHD